MDQVRTATRLSRYLRTREQGAWTAVFHELHPDVWHVPTTTWRDLRDARSLPPVATAELRRSGLLAGPAGDDAPLAAAQPELTRRLDRAGVLYLVLVQGCRHGCAGPGALTSQDVTTVTYDNIGTKSR